MGVSRESWTLLHYPMPSRRLRCRSTRLNRLLDLYTENVLNTGPLSAAYFLPNVERTIATTHRRTTHRYAA